ncbi:hypothetical protein WAB17_09900 [Parerythrobacter aurantius]|uniref:hypothetical protein n=1 Tax=Parerythrobacter aurantius TaxID=3127706 RepID=UPI00324E8C15
MPRPSFTRALALSGAFALACCSPPPPQPLPPPVQRPAPAPAPAPLAPPADPGKWIDAPQTAGDWSYQATSTGSVAQFAAGAGQPLLALACNLSRREVQLARPGSATQGVPMRVLTETAERLVTASPAADRSDWLIAPLRATDPLLDAMALTRGRFAVETAGLPTLYVPAWAEVTRVIEDCR